MLEASDLESALALLESDPDIDLVLLDLHMPGNHGLAGLAAVRAQFPQVAVAVCSGHDDPRVVRRVLDHGAAGFVPKRTDMAQIRHALAAMLDCETWLPDDLHRAMADTASNPADSDLAARLASLTPQQFRVLSRPCKTAVRPVRANVMARSRRSGGRCALPAMRATGAKRLAWPCHRQSPAAASAGCNRLPPAPR